jgi:uncharacterized protein
LTAPTYRLGPDFYSRLDRLVDELIPRGLAALEADLSAIDAFAAAARSEDPGRDAHALRTTPREVYLLEALSFAVLDRVHRPAFEASDRVLVVLPDCLSLHNPGCRKVEGEHGARCARCTPTCPAARATALAEKYGAGAIFSERDLEALLTAHRGEGGLGVVGIACVLMLAGGMRTAALLGVPPRGVLLEGCGCEHWNDEVFGTTFALERLEAILAGWEAAPGHRAAADDRG